MHCTLKVRLTLKLSLILRTLDLVESKVKEGGKYNLTQFSVHQLISPANIELIGKKKKNNVIKFF